jgi:hypothetical protein
MTSKSPLLTLNNGVQIPAIGLGVLQRAPEQTPTAVESAIAHGYRLIDTAAAYANERQVGEGMRQSGISRDDMFIETKVWIIDDGYEATLQSQPQAGERSGPVSPSDKSRCEVHRLVCMTTYQKCLTVGPRSCRAASCPKRNSHRQRSLSVWAVMRRVATKISNSANSQALLSVPPNPSSRVPNQGACDSYLGDP